MVDRLRRSRRPLCAALVATATLLGLAASAAADTFDLYAPKPADDFLLPSVPLGFIQGGALMDNLPDGRLLVVTTRIAPDFTTDGVELWVETSAGLHTFQSLGDLPNLPHALGLTPDWYSPGAFLSVSQDPLLDGSVRVAVGDAAFSLGVFTLDPNALAPLSSIHWFGYYGDDVLDGNFVASAAWQNNNSLAVATGDFSGDSHVYLLDVNSATATVILDAPGGTGGVAFDAAGNLYYGIGYVPDPSSAVGYAVGDISRFDAGTWPTDFLSGTHVTTLLSAGWLQFDADGNLLVGGGDTFGSSGQFNYFAISDGSGASRPTLKPDPDSTSALNAYNVMYNEKTGEIFAWDNFGSAAQQVWAYAAAQASDPLATAAPEPSTIVLLATASTLAGVVVLRRRLRRTRLIMIDDGGHRGSE